MIQVNELRIGNIIYVSAKSGNGRRVIRRVGLSEMEHIINNDGSFNYEPIPLTEELLSKLGFNGQKGYARGIKYLHQLQNLYFAVNGQELTVNI